MKEFLSALLIIATFSAAPVLAGVVAQAETGTHHPARIERALDLTPAQRQQIEPILRDGERRMRELRGQASAAALGALSPDHRSRVQQIAADANRQIRAVWSSRQPSTDASASPQPRHGAMRGEITSIVAKSAGEIDALLTPQESQAVLTQRQTFESERDTILASTASRMRPLLTGDQQQKLDTWSAKMKGHATRVQQADAGRFLLMAAAPPRG